MVTLTPILLADITERLVQALRPQRIYLFGSRAYGSPRPDSDLDLLIVMPDGEDGRHGAIRVARQAVGSIGLAVDVQVHSADRFDRRSGWRANFEHTVRNKGKLLFGVDGMSFAQEWLEKARNDMRSVRALLGLQPPIRDTASFHCQQAAEKTLKAFLVYHNEPFEKVHDLDEICALCEKFDPDFASLRTRAASLNEYAVDLRYPGIPDPTQEQVENAMKTAEDVCAFVLARLPEELRKVGGGG